MKMIREICLPIIAFSIGGCVEIHSDYVSKFHVYGIVTAENANNIRPGEVLNIELIDVDLDDSRRPDQRVILNEEISLGKEFYLTREYFWGSSNPDAMEAGRVSVALMAKGCDPWTTQYTMSDVLGQRNEVVIKLGTVRLKC